MRKANNEVTNLILARRLEAAQGAVNRLVSKVFRHATHGGERFSEVVARLGEEHPDVSRYRAADIHLSHIETEAQKRMGPDIPRVSLATYLRINRTRRTTRR